MACMGVQRCLYCVWIPGSIRHFSVEYNHEFFLKQIVPRCNQFLALVDSPSVTKLPPFPKGKKDETEQMMYKYFPDCDPMSIDRTFRSSMSEVERQVLLQVNYCP